MIAMLGHLTPPYYIVKDEPHGNFGFPCRVSTPLGWRMASSYEQLLVLWSSGEVVERAIENVATRQVEAVRPSRRAEIAVVERLRATLDLLIDYDVEVTTTHGGNVWITDLMVNDGR